MRLGGISRCIWIVLVNLALVSSSPGAAASAPGTSTRGPDATEIAASRSQPDSAPPSTLLDPVRAGLKGMVGHWWYIHRYGSALVDLYVWLGVTNVRLAIDWRDIEEFAAGQRSFAHIDPIMNEFADHGIEVIPVVANVPVWASLNPAECASDAKLCSFNIDALPAFQSTMSQLIARYPEVRRWEFWNEPEMWAGLRRASDYEPWYRAFYKAAKTFDPRLEVAVGTLSGWDFVSRLSPDLPMDAVSLHPYAGDDWGIDTKGIERLHAGLLDRGLNVPIWITEYGWAQWMDPQRRVRSLNTVFLWMQNHPYIELAEYHMLHDTDEQAECCWGLVGPGPAFEPHEPAASAYRAIAVSGWDGTPRSHPVRIAPTLASTRPSSRAEQLLPAPRPDQ